MQITTVTRNQIDIAVLASDAPLFTDTNAALDVMATVQYDTGCTRMAIPKALIAEEFFRLSSGLAGEILQKFINYRVKVAIIGDYSGYTSKSLKDFMYESNNGRDIFFVATEEDALERLSKA